MTYRTRVWCQMWLFFVSHASFCLKLSYVLLLLLTSSHVSEAAAVPFCSLMYLLTKIVLSSRSLILDLCDSVLTWCWRWVREGPIALAPRASVQSYISAETLLFPTWMYLHWMSPCVWVHAVASGVSHQLFCALVRFGAVLALWDAHRLPRCELVAFAAL